MNRFVTRLLTIIGRISQFWYWVGREYFQKNCVQSASALTLSSLLAMVPLLVVIISITSVFPSEHNLHHEIQSFIFENFVPSTGQEVEAYIEQITRRSLGLPVLAVVFLFIVSLMMMMTLDKALNGLWHIKVKRPFPYALLIYWALLTIGPVLMGTGIGVSSYLISLNVLHSVSPTIELYFLYALPALFTFTTFTFCYRFIPYVNISWFNALSGALIATILFELAKKVFAFYVTNVPTYEIIYGTLSTIPLFILWVYFSWLIFMFGAVIVNGLYLSQAQRDRHRRQSRFIVALRLMRHLYHYQQYNSVCRLEDLLELERYTSIPNLQEVLDTLRRCGFVYNSSNTEEYVLNTDMDKLTLLSFYNSLHYYLPVRERTAMINPAYQQLCDDISQKMNVRLINFL